MAGWDRHPEKPSTAAYFYGRITRDEAEEILTDHGLVAGMFLLRESISPLGNYAISLCHENRVHHYSIEKQTDGRYMIPAGKKFLGPIELIKHHQKQKDGIVTLLTVGCCRLPNQVPVAFRGMTYSDLEHELVKKADSIKGVNKERALGAQREHLVIMVAKDLHMKQPWYHGKIDRLDSEGRLRLSGHKDGKFLVRLREDKKTFAVCISYQKDTRHYLIDKDENNKFGIQDGPKFDCIMMLIDHYHNKQDGLLCKLTEPCPNPGFHPEELQKYMDCNVSNMDYFMMKSKPSLNRPPRLGPAPSLPGQTPPPLPSAAKRPSLKERLESKIRPAKPREPRELPPIPVFARGDWEGAPGSNNIGFDSRRVTLQRMGMDAEGLEDIYDRVPRTLADFDLRPDQIELQDILGSGQFGSVRRGMCTIRNGEKIPVAVKTLKQEDCPSSQEPELIREAKVMMPLSHKHIVRMIGVCKSESIMLVLELAPLGTLNSYLQNHKETTQANIVELLWQVAMGMEYLESKKFVHRDLAARNVLLVSEHFAKISDFGMSKALCRDNNYYEAKEAGKWPLKWYAPECVYFWKFDSKSDVWSYGVTMWEATSYGDRPYKKMKGQEIIRFLVDEGRRLLKPEYCDEEVYDIMKQCWEFEKSCRPTFAEISCSMKSLCVNMQRKCRDSTYMKHTQQSALYLELQ